MEKNIIKHKLTNMMTEYETTGNTMKVMKLVNVIQGDLGGEESDIMNKVEPSLKNWLEMNPK